MVRFVATDGRLEMTEYDDAEYEYIILSTVPAVVAGSSKTGFQKDSAPTNLSSASPWPSHQIAPSWHILCDFWEIQTCKIALNARSLTARFFARLTNFMNCTTALNPFFSTLGFKFIYKQNNVKYCMCVDFIDVTASNFTAFSSGLCTTLWYILCISVRYCYDYHQFSKYTTFT